ncbi:MAG: VCBS repeat-containing protein, partial [Pyrinomonadaceae bacterium]|nr:VCBS repeat-containing protein [Pyrinomonadaceae bacterium]
MNAFLPARRWPSASVLILLVSLIAASATLSCRRDNLPDPSSKEYRDVVSAFYTGLASLDVGDDSRAECYLTWTTQLVPDEPAGWANRGLLLLRQREFDKAFEDLERARLLAPDNDQINVLLASVESNRGRFNEAITLLRKAVAANPQNLRARYALASEIERAGGEGGDREAQTLLDEILQRQPDNLAVQLELVRLAAKRGDAETLRTGVARLAANPVVQTPDVQGQFAALQTAAGSGNPRLAANRVAFLRNVLVRTPQYRKSLRQVRTPPEEGGEPLAKFVSLPSPEPNPAATDTGVTFTAETLQSDAGGKAWPWSGVVSLTGEGAPATVVADGREVRIMSGATLAFPGGSQAPAPGGHGILSADLNYDWKTDLVFAGAGGVRLFRQGDANQWRDVTPLTKLSPAIINDSYAGAWAADVDLDGDLDIVLGKTEGAARVLRNNGDDTFNLLEPFSGAAGSLRGFAWADIDADGDPDATLLNADGQLQVFANERAGQFTLLPSLPTGNRAVGLSVADINRDGLLDILALNADGRIVRVSINSEGTAGPTWNTAELTRWTIPGSDPLGNAAIGAARLFAADIDNNGGLDLVASVMNGASTAGSDGGTFSQAWLSGKNEREEKFTALGTPTGARVFAVADMTEDGRLDFVGLSASGQPLRAVNRGTKNYHWQVIRPRSQQATGDQRINSFGIGGEMEIRSGLLVQKQVITSPLIHFGLGEQTRADVVRIVWPNGSPRAEFDLQADQTILAEQRLKGSCPSLFAWNGKGMDFVKDCTPWSSALGLRINAQDTADILQPEEWNKIPGSKLASRDGFYDLRITAELWETFYIDHYSLMAVDHPAGTEVFVDERFSVPPPKLALYTVNTPQPFASARDDQGQDVTDIVRAEDA